MTEDELEVIRQRCNNATSGPWLGPRITDDWPPGWVGVYVAEPETGEPIPFGIIGICGRYDADSIVDNAEFIAHAREDIPKLLDEIEKLENWWLEKWWSEILDLTKP